MKARNYVYLALLMIFLSNLHPIFQVKKGYGINFLFTGLEFLSLPIFFIAIKKYRQTDTDIVNNKYLNNKIKRYFIAILILMIYGLISTRNLTLVIWVAWGYFFIGVFILLGKHDQVWKDLEKVLIVQFWFSAFLVLLFFYTPKAVAIGGDIVLYYGEGERAFTSTLGYDLSKMLECWPMLFALSFYRERRDIWKIMGIATAPFFVILQIFYSKRAPFIRSITYVVFSMLVILLFKNKKNLMQIIIVIVLVTGAALSQLPRFNYLIERYRETNLFRNERFDEAAAVIRDMNILEYMVGKGMGGYYEPPDFWTVGYFNRDGVFVNSFVHVGILQPFLNGGIIFCFIYYSFFISYFRRKPRDWFNNKYNLVAFSVIPVYLISIMIEGPPTYSAVFNAIFVGMIASRSSIIKYGSLRFKRRQGDLRNSAGHDKIRGDSIYEKILLDG